MAIPATELSFAGGPSIKAITCRLSHRRLRAPFRTALRQVDRLSIVDVEVGWSDGRMTSASVSPTPQITGETQGSIEAAVTGPIADAVSGVSLGCHEEIFRRLHAALYGNNTAKCAVDLAVHAALAADGGGWWRLVGGGPAPVRTDVTISLAAPEAMARESSARPRKASTFSSSSSVTATSPRTWPG